MLSKFFSNFHQQFNLKWKLGSDSELDVCNQICVHVFSDTFIRTIVMLLVLNYSAVLQQICNFLDFEQSWLPKRWAPPDCDEIRLGVNGIE